MIFLVKKTAYMTNNKFIFNTKLFADINGRLLRILKVLQNQPVMKNMDLILFNETLSKSKLGRFCRWCNFNIDKAGKNAS